MIRTVSQIRDEWADREAIRDCLFRYSRAIDRCDMTLLASAYWPGAIDRHSGFTGTIEAFIAWAEPRLRAIPHSVHMLGNILIQVEGETAKVETYFWSVNVLAEGEVREALVSGRYLDRFERRDDQWRIAERMVVHDWFREAADTGDWSKGPFGWNDLALGRAAPDDSSYAWLGLS
jgi:SnoaL-like protein